MKHQANSNSPTVPAPPPDTRSNLEKKLDAENGLVWAEIHAAQNAQEKVVNFSDDGPAMPQVQPKELGEPLNDVSLRLAQKDGLDLTEDERKRLDAAKHRDHIERTMALAVDASKAIAEVHKKIRAKSEYDAEALIKKFIAGERDFTSDEMKVMTDAIDRAKAEQWGDDATQLAQRETYAQSRERVRILKIREIHAVATAITNGTATPAQRARWSAFNTGAVAKHLHKGRPLAELPIDAVENF